MVLFMGTMLYSLLFQVLFMTSYFLDFMMKQTTTIERVMRIQGSHSITLCLDDILVWLLMPFLGSNRMLLEDLLAIPIMSETYNKGLTCLPGRFLRTEEASPSSQKALRS
jgi:hypothetical protein